MDELMPKVENWFDFLTVHKDMLDDKRRTDSYKMAIEKVVREGDVVVDVGTGTGILAFMAVLAGAKKVYAIEKMNIINLAKKIAGHNGLSDKIYFVRGDSKEVDIPEKADVIVSEVIGHFALDENMLDSIIDARKRFLKEDGVIIPKRVDLFFAPVTARKEYSELTYWKSHFYGIDYTPAFQEAVSNVYIDCFYPKQFLTEHKLIRSINLTTEDDVNLSAEAEFNIQRSGKLHGFVGWFEAYLLDEIKISTSPYDPPTHWLCTFFPIEKPYRLTKDDLIKFRFKSNSTGCSVVWEWSGEFRSADSLHTIHFRKNTSNYLSV